MELINKEILEEDEEQKNKAISLKDSAIRRLNLSIDKHINVKEYKMSNNLSYWLKTFSKYHDEEKEFDFSKIKTYSRGDIIKANLGFNVGNELGGLHYCLVLNKLDNHSFGVLTVIPLTSIKPEKTYAKYSVDLSDELHQLLVKKYEKMIVEIKPQLEEALKELENNGNADKIKMLSDKLEYLEKIKTEIEHMKNGSIALVSQITTISKQRIYDPINNNGILSKIRLSPKSLDRIDAEIIKMLTK